VFVVWAAFGLIVYGFYGRRRSALAGAQPATAPPPSVSPKLG
jgi:hypothetical protein